MSLASRDADTEDRIRSDERLIASVIAALVLFTLLGFGAGYLAAPGPLDIPSFSAPFAARLER